GKSEPADRPAARKREALDPAGGGRSRLFRQHRAGADRLSRTRPRDRGDRKRGLALQRLPRESTPDRAGGEEAVDAYECSPMSWQPSNDPVPGDARSCDAIEHVIVPRARDLGGFEVRRALPAAQKQMVGPFIFFDQMGPAEFLIGGGIDVR